MYLDNTHVSEMPFVNCFSRSLACLFILLVMSLQGLFLDWNRIDSNDQSVLTLNC